MSVKPRGIRNNNPGNIRRNGDPWQGLAETQGDKEFFTFATPVYGIRALARTLITYQDRHGLRTIRQIISRWAPPVENDTESYVKAVTAATTGIGLVEALQQTLDPAREALLGLVPYLETAKWLLLAVTLIGIGIMLWERIDDHRKGLR